MIDIHIQYIQHDEFEDKYAFWKPSPQSMPPLKLFCCPLVFVIIIIVNKNI